MSILKKVGRWWVKYSSFVWAIVLLAAALIDPPSGWKIVLVALVWLIAGMTLSDLIRQSVKVSS